MKTSKLFLLSLVVVVVASTGVAQLEAMKRAEPDSGFDVIGRIEETQASSDTQKIINPGLNFVPNDPDYYAIIEQELDALKVYLAEINKNAEWVTTDDDDDCLFPFSYQPQLEEIPFTENNDAKEKAPTTYKLISEKMHKIGKKMGVDSSAIKIFINIDELNGPVINAAATTAKKEISFHVGLIKLMVWLEGSDQYYQTEGLLDAVIAHELAHIFHGHQHNNHENIKQEFEADKTGAQCIKITRNMISSNLIIELANELFPSLGLYSNLYLNKEETFSVVCILSSALIKQHPNLEALGNCATHKQFAHNVNRAVEVIKNTEYSTKYSFWSDETKKLEECDLQSICSLIYDQLVARCLKADLLPENYKQSWEKPTHPCPRERKDAILAFIQEKEEKHRCSRSCMNKFKSQF